MGATAGESTERLRESAPCAAACGPGSWRKTSLPSSGFICSVNIGFSSRGGPGQQRHDAALAVDHCVDKLARRAARACSGSGPRAFQHVRLLVHCWAAWGCCVWRTAPAGDSSRPSSRCRFKRSSAIAAASRVLSSSVGPRPPEKRTMSARMLSADARGADEVFERVADDGLEGDRVRRGR